MAFDFWKKKSAQKTSTVTSIPTTAQKTSAAACTPVPSAAICEPATAEKIWKVLKNIALHTDNGDWFRQITVEIPEEHIPWFSLRALIIYGSAAETHNTRLLKAWVQPGAYTNADRTCLVLIHPKESAIQGYLDRCGSRLTRLYLQKTSLAHLDVSALTALEMLDASSNPRLSTVRGLSHMSRLTSLDLSWCGSLLELPGLGNLTQLTSLNLPACNSLRELPDLGCLTQLTSLNLSACINLQELPGLEYLTQLTSLNLPGCICLGELPGLGCLTQLTSLNLSGCKKIQELPGLGCLTQLTFLSLSWCRSIQELPEGIRNLKSLHSLELNYMHLRELPDWLPEIAESFFLDSSSVSAQQKATVSLYATTVDTIPDMSIFSQPYEVVAEWFRSRSVDTMQTLNEIKVVFLGDGEAGKSHTIARLMNDGGDPIDYIDQSTPGIVIKHRAYDLDGRNIQVHYWDFGGQEIMHSMHRIFLTSRTMYVVLLNARDDTQGDRAHYWLQNIQSFAPDAPVLLVLNKIDQNPKASVDERTLRARYPGLTEILRLSALKFDQKRFNEEFTDILLQQIRKNDCLDAQWPNSWIQVKKRLENMESHFILGDEYRKICRECKLENVELSMLKWFNDLGVSFCFCDEEDYELEDHVILRPDWITNGLYIILFNQLEGAKNGLIPHKSIFRLLKNVHTDPEIRCTLPNAKYDSGDIQYVLGVMRKFQLSMDTKDGREFIPMLCQQESTVDISALEEDAHTLEFSMDFDYLPENLLHRLMVERHEELDIANAWRRGAQFRIDDLGYSAVVFIDTNNTLRFFIRHTDPMHRPNTYLAMLKANVDRIVTNMGLKAPSCRLIYKIDGKRDEFDYEDVKLNRELGDTTMTSKAHRKKILIEDILNQSAPDGLQDEMRLLNAIRRSCIRIQDEPGYRRDPSGSNQGLEDRRNRRIRDDLELLGYRVSDQSQRGGGELDLCILDEQGNSWTIIEALRISSGAKREWNEHLNKLVGRYNTNGLSVLYLLTYVDADPAGFDRIWTDYQEHIPNTNAGGYTCVKDSRVELNDNGHQYIKTAKYRYVCGSLATNVYHIFVQIAPQGK